MRLSVPCNDSLVMQDGGFLERSCVQVAWGMQVIACAVAAPRFVECRHSRCIWLVLSSCTALLGKKMDLFASVFTFLHCVFEAACFFGEVAAEPNAAASCLSMYVVEQSKISFS